MRIDPSKANILEKDIEDYLYANPSCIETRYSKVTKWIKRQYPVPSGIIDLLGIAEDGDLVLVEVKNVAIDASALTQISRYAFDIENVIGIILLNEEGESPPTHLYKVLVGRSVDSRTFVEAEALNIDVITFAVEMHLETTSPLTRTQESRDRTESQYLAMANDPDIAEVIRAQKTAWEKYLENPPWIDVIEQAAEIVSGHTDSYEQATN